MVEIKVVTYEEARREYFEEQMQKAQRRIKYWDARIDRSRPHNMKDPAALNAADAGWEYNFYKDALEALENHPKWISVEERLPGNEDERCLVFTSDEKESEIAYYCGDGEWVSPDCKMRTSVVTHWMNLPESPKEEA